MGRGATTTPAKQQQAIDQTAENQALSTQNALGGTIIPQEENELAHPGYTPAQQSAINNATLGALKTAYDALGERVQNQATATRNNAASTPAMVAAAGQEASALANQNAQNQEAFANDAQQQQLQAQELLNQIYGDQNSLFGAASGAGANTAATLAKGSSPWYDEVIPAGVSAALGSLSA